MNTTLNKKLFDKNRELYRDVRNAILNIVGEFVDSVDVGLAFPILDIIIVGSNAGYNYTENSDLDVHIIVNYEDLCSCNKELVGELFQSERSLFNQSHDITIKGIPVEVYVEDIKTGTASNGIYSVMYNRWEKIPILSNQKDVEVDFNKYGELFSIIEKILNGEQSEPVTYEQVSDIINSLYLMRKYSIANDGESGEGNLVFKRIRDMGWLDELKELSLRLKSDELSIKEKGEFNED